MSDDRDPLEFELQSMRPAPLSLEARDGIGRRISRDDRRAGARRWLWAGALAAAACVAIAIIGWRLAPHAGSRLAIVHPSPNARTVSEPAPDPTVVAYQMAWDESPARLDALLDAQAARSTGSEFPRWRAFTAVGQNSIR